MTPLAHGIGSVRDLPVPTTFFYTTAAIVLVVSFAALGVLWKRPLLERHEGGRVLPSALQAILLARALRVAVQAVAVALFVVTFASALFGTTVELLNWAPTFVYVIFWVGVPMLSVLLGNVWRLLSPWRAIADLTVWALERGGKQARPILAVPAWMGRYPAAAALFAFVALELTHPSPAAPRTLAVAISFYTYWALAGMALYGREEWSRHGEGFAVAFGLLGRLAPFAVKDGAVVVRWPLTGLAGPDRTPGALLFLAVLIGSTSFDGFSRTTFWQDLVADVRGRYVDESVRVLDLATTGVNLAGLTALVLAVVVTYLAAVESARLLVHAPRSLVPDFVLPLVPIAFAYIVAHYFSLILIQGQFIITLASDPFGRGWDLFGTASFAPNLTVVSPETVWYAQVIALTIGHVAGLAIAHDRAVSLFRDRGDALRSQYPMLALMVLYTVGGLWLLSQS
jgi:hypothetical protein